jgi:hypothetical protein
VAPRLGGEDDDRSAAVHRHGRGQLPSPELLPSLPSAGERERVKYAGPATADEGAPPFLLFQRMLQATRK